jgi:glycosyltransferase involved in cell wall biosynthesis
MLDKIWIISPCFYDFEAFAQLRRRTEQVLAENFPASTPIFVLIDDSAGQDPQVRAEIASGSDLIVITPPYNLGHQGAIVYALRALSASMDDDDFVVILDSDGEDSPEDIPSLVRPLQMEKAAYKVSLAQRTRRNESLVFKTLYTFFKVFFSVLTGTIVKNGNFAAFRGAFAKAVVVHPCFDYCYSSSLLVLATNRHNVPLPRGKRYAGQSKMTTVSLISHGFRMLLPFAERIAIRAIMTSACLVFAALALGAGTALLAWNHFSSFAAIGLLALALLMVSTIVLATSCIFFLVHNQTRALMLRRLTGMDGETSSARFAAAGLERSYERSENALAPKAKHQV